MVTHWKNDEIYFIINKTYFSSLKAFIFTFYDRRKQKFPFYKSKKSYWLTKCLTNSYIYLNIYILQETCKNLIYIYIYIQACIYIYIYIYIMLKGKMKSQYVIGMLLWVSCFCIHQAYFYIFCLSKNKENKITHTT